MTLGIPLDDVDESVDAYEQHVLTSDDFDLVRLGYLFLLVDNVDLRDQREGLQPNRKAPAELEERMVLGVGMQEHGQQENHRIDVQVMVEAVSVVVVALGQSSVPDSKVS